MPVAAWSEWHRSRGMQAPQVCLGSSTFSFMPALISALIHIIFWLCILLKLYYQVSEFITRYFNNFIFSASDLTFLAI
jgi:hypothetical protein